VDQECSPKKVRGRLEKKLHLSIENFNDAPLSWKNQKTLPPAPSLLFYTLEWTSVTDGPFQSNRELKEDLNMKLKQRNSLHESEQYAMVT